MALHKTFSIGGGTIEFHVASTPGETFIGQNASGPADAPSTPANLVLPNGKQTVITTPFQKIVNPA